MAASLNRDLEIPFTTTKCVIPSTEAAVGK